MAPLTNPFCTVGVTGSGKGMTAVAAPQKHKFTPDDNESPSLQCVPFVLSPYFPVTPDVLIDA